MVIGLIIVLVGLSLLAAELIHISIPWGPIVIILIGIFVISRWFRVRSRRR
jgi:hypothetical protein